MSDALRQPGRTYELITPARRPLVTSAGSLKQADLLPSSLLNFRRVLASSHVHTCTVSVLAVFQLQCPSRDRISSMQAE